PVVSEPVSETPPAHVLHVAEQKNDPQNDQNHRPGKRAPWTRRRNLHRASHGSPHSTKAERRSPAELPGRRRTQEAKAAEDLPSASATGSDRRPAAAPARCGPNRGR